MSQHAVRIIRNFLQTLGPMKRNAARSGTESSASNGSDTGLGEEVRKVIATLPVTVDESDINLVIYEGQKAAEAVEDFCKKHMAEAGSACMDQLLPHVERKLSDKL